MARRTRLAARFRASRQLVFCVLAFLSFGLLAGCGSTPPAAGQHYPDPLEPINRASYQGHIVVDELILRPAASTYDSRTPSGVRAVIVNVMGHWSLPGMIVNALLQGKFNDAVDHAGRFVLNSTVGLLGLIDVASPAGLEQPDEDFGQTLAAWGVPSGPYLFIPVLGPTNLRDGLGTVVDFVANPMTYAPPLPRMLNSVLFALELRASVLSLDASIRQSPDPYAFIRNAYTQRREFVIHDGNPPLGDLYDLYYYDWDE